MKIITIDDMSDEISWHFSIFCIINSIKYLFFTFRNIINYINDIINTYNSFAMN